MRDLRDALAVLRAVARASQGERSVAEILTGVCQEISEGFGFERVSISRLDEQEGVVIRVAAHGVWEDALPVRLSVKDSWLVEKASRTRELVFVSDASKEQALPPELVEQFGVTSMFVLPLVSAGRCLGFLSGDNAGVAFELDPAEVDVLETAGAFAATLLEKALVQEEMRRLDEAKTRFVAFAAHELRTPIQAVYGMLATVHHRGSELAEDQLVELRASAYKQAERLRHLAEQLLDLSRLDAVAYELAPQPLIIRRAVEETVLLVAEQGAGDVHVDISPDLELPVDSTVLDRVVANLLLNALRYGAPPVAIAADRQDRHFRLRVTDRGPGVPDEFKAALFDRFARAPESGGTEGSGLGLAIAQSYARAHGGELAYQALEPHGACFEFVLPLAPP